MNGQMSLKEAVKNAEEKKVAIGHFNISDLVALKAIFEAVRGLKPNEKTPVIIGLSEGERAFVGAHEAAALIRYMRSYYDYPIFINADHTRDFERVKEAVDAGFDSIIFDNAKVSLEENIKKTKEGVDFIRSVNPNIIIEGEVGYIGTSSAMFDKLPEGAAITEDTITKPEEAARFVKETGVDMLAPAVGNVHGMFKNAPNPRLFINRIREIKQAAGVPLVLHGGSGIPDEDFTQAIDAGCAIIHINTEIRKAWRMGVEEKLKANPDEVAPAKILQGAYDEMTKVLVNRLRLFNKIV